MVAVGKKHILRAVKRHSIIHVDVTIRELCIHLSSYVIILFKYQIICHNKIRPIKNSQSYLLSALLFGICYCYMLVRTPVIRLFNKNAYLIHDLDHVCIFLLNSPFSHWLYPRHDNGFVALYNEVKKSLLFTNTSVLCLMVCVL